MTQNFRHHMDVLKQPASIDGYKAWATVAAVCRSVGYSPPDGSTAVEVMWAELKTMLLDAPVRRISRRWWKFLSWLGFLRVSYRHVHRGRLPAFAHGDTSAAMVLGFVGHLCDMVRRGSFEDMQSKWEAFVEDERMDERDSGDEESDCSSVAGAGGTGEGSSE